MSPEEKKVLQEREFSKHMEGRQFGHEERLDAKEHFDAGFEAALGVVYRYLKGE